MRFTMLAMVALVAIGVTGSAPAEDQVPPAAAAGDYVPCGCGGPKAIYAAQYGTVQPPALQQEKAAEAADSSAPATAASPESETETGG